ncbi:uncharacterized protein LOC110442892 isoform X2 [Mizuhopecten yessoensis]|nr:uncharacterized protein LOC110442892 isoform X2 [Mizuhopecten yessoensis]
MNCRKALEKFDNDIDKAEQWLLKEAQKEGWAKATKLQGRPMSQGLVGVVSDNQRATVVEINCETDFVSKNEKFQDLVSKVASGCHRYFMAAPTSTQVNKKIFLSMGSYCVPCERRHFSTMRPCLGKSKAASQASNYTKVKPSEKGGNSCSFLSHYNDILKVTAKPTVEKLPDGAYTWIYFDLETTGLGFSDITQLSARAGDQLFTRYVIPGKPINEVASQMTGITFVKGKLYKNERPVQAVSATECMTDFADWLSHFHSPVLVAHNALFDALVLCNCLSGIKDQEVSRIVDGFVDTLRIFRQVLPNRTRHNLESLVTDLLGIVYQAHDANQDAEVLQKLVKSEKITDALMCQSSYTFSYIQDYVAYKKQTDKCKVSLQPLIQADLLTKHLADKIARTGLGLHHLEFVHSQAGAQGIHKLFTETSQGKLEDKKMINNVAAYLQKSRR